MICPKCAGENTFVLKTIKELKVYRWRRCKECNYSFLTEEKPVKDKDIIVYIEELEKIESGKSNDKKPY